MAFMKTLLTIGFLLPAMILLSGCYTILLVEPTDEIISYNPSPMPPDPGPWPQPTPPPPPPPRPPHFPPPPPPPTTGPVIIVIHPTPTPPSSDIQRPIRTGRGPLDLNSTLARNDENNSRDSGVQRGGQPNPNPPPARNDDNNNRPSRDSDANRGRR